MDFVWITSALKIKLTCSFEMKIDTKRGKKERSRKYDTTGKY
jgi:hypothetical protein